jgi:hypothetical protein
MAVGGGFDLTTDRAVTLAIDRYVDALQYAAVKHCAQGGLGRSETSRDLPSARATILTPSV